MKYAWIQKHSKSKDGWPISMLCEQLGVSISGYHQHQRSGATNKPSTVVDGGKRINNDVLLAHIKAIHAQVKGEKALCSDHRQPPQAAHCSQADRARFQSCTARSSLDKRHHLHRHRRRLVIPDGDD
jgi:hypothetical protein